MNCSHSVWKSSKKSLTKIIGWAKRDPLFGPSWLQQRTDRISFWGCTSLNIWIFTPKIDSIISNRNLTSFGREKNIWIAAYRKDRKIGSEIRMRWFGWFWKNATFWGHFLTIRVMSHAFASVSSNSWILKDENTIQSSCQLSLSSPRKRRQKNICGCLDGPIFLVPIVGHIVDFGSFLSPFLWNNLAKV